MKLLKLTIQNFKRIEVAVLEKLGDVVAVTGKNRAGKSSACEAITALFEGITKTQIRKGAKAAEIQGQVGEYTITRRRSDKGSVLEVTDSNGDTVPKAAKFIEEIKSELSINPGQFNKMNDIDITKAIMSTLNVNLDEFDEAIGELEAERLTLSRQLKQLGKPVPAPKADPVDLSAIMSKNQEAMEHNAELDRATRELSGLNIKIAEAKKQLLQMESDRDKLETHVESTSHIALIDTSEAEAQHDAYQRYEKFITIKEQHNRLTAQHEQADADIKALREERIREFQEKANGMFTGYEMDVDGKTITLNGLAPSQWSNSERMRIASIIGAANNPEANIVLIDNAEAFDAESRKELVEWAREKDIQLILFVCEGVDVAGTDNVLRIEAGEVQ
jgi:predicted ATP-dependent endonuclease of OLD family